MVKAQENEKVEAVIVYATFPDFETARAMADVLITDHIAGCVNLLPAMTSVYRWEGAVETADEVVMIVKTMARLRDKVIASIEASHPYDTPAVIAFDISAGSTRYLDWIASETTPKAV